MSYIPCVPDKHLSGLWNTGNFVTKFPLAFLNLLIYTLFPNDSQAALGYGMWSICKRKTGINIWSKIH